MALYAILLGRRGHDVTVVAPPHGRPSLKDRLRSLARSGRWPRIPSHHPSHFEGVGLDLRILDRYRPVVDADVPDADVVIATWWETAEWVDTLSPSKGAKVYFVQHHEVFDHQPIERVKATLRLPMPKIAVSGWLADLLRDEYGSEDVSLVPNAVDHDLFHAARRAKNPTPTFGVMYSLAHFKGCDLSLRAFALASERTPGLRLVAFGEGPVDPSLPLPPGAEYHLAPPQDSIRSIYAKCDALLFGSRSEGFGLPILEAMACRTPVIGTPAGAAPELLIGGSGILVRPDDPEDMARAIGRVAALPPDSWAEMSDAAHAMAAQHRWDTSADLFEAALARYSGAGRVRTPCG